MTIGGLSRINDARQRGYALAERLDKLDVDSAIDVVKTIRKKAMEGHEDYLRLYNGLLVCNALEEVFGQEKISALVEAAQKKSDFDVIALLVEIPCDGKEDRPHQPFLDGPLKETPLGMRKSLAKKPNFKLIQRIARDQDHRVIEHLLNNSRLTETDVIHIGAARPTSPKVLEAIYSHPRWIARYRVKKTIVFNPYTPLSIALRLLAYLSVQDLEQLCSLSEVNSALLREAKKLAARKSQGMQAEYWLDEEPGD